MTLARAGLLSACHAVMKNPIHVSKPRKVSVHRLFTVTGRPVYVFGWKHTLEHAEHRLPAQTIDPITTEHNLARLARASADVGEQCEWRYHGETEVMDVSF